MKRSWYARLCLALLPMALAGLSSLIQAQQIYRIVGPDGRVTFTDKAPTPDSKSRISTIDTVLPPGTANTGNLPFDLQQIAKKYPVILYTTNNCSVCLSARSYLTGRGVPFAEKTVNSPEEIEAFQKLSNDNTMPFLTIGPQSLKGFNEVEWSQYLTAAAYPMSSALPAGYRYASAAPIIARKPEPAAPETASRAPVQNIPVQAPPSNPAGIRF